jgi:hypothetical protein
VLNLDGDLVRNLDDQCVSVSRDSIELTYIFDCLSYVTFDKEIIISYWKSGLGSSINVSNLLTGKCLGKIVNKKLDSEIITLLTYDNCKDEEGKVSATL